MPWKAYPNRKSRYISGTQEQTRKFKTISHFFAQKSSRHRQDQLHHKHHPQQSLSSATLSAKHAHNNVGTASHSQLGENIVYATGGAFCGPTAGNGAAATATASNPAHLSRQRVEQYFRSLPRDGSANGGGGGGAPMHSQKMMQMAKTASKASSELVSVV